MLNGDKRWIGHGTFADLIVVWARNLDQGGRVQGFVVEKGAKGFKATKMMNKMSCRMTQNADIELKDVFVPDENYLEKAKDF